MVFFKRPWIAGKILMGAKLGGVDENGNDDLVIFFFRAGN